MKTILLSAILLILLAGCGSAPRQSPLPEPTRVPVIPSVTPTVTLEPVSTAEVLPSATPAELQVCSPVAGYKLADLAGMVVNPYHPPEPGSDEPHQGVDLAQLDPQLNYAVSGATVQALLAGRVASVTRDRFPWGNMIIIETPLTGGEAEIHPFFGLPTPFPEPLPAGALTCPPVSLSPAALDAPRSFYVMYAHLLNTPDVAVGDQIGCGEPIGTIGQSGNALNPHLHLEVRVGPTGLTIPVMAHYDASATAEEMAAYCLWRVSGVFQTINPGCFWGDCVTP